jgi:predicted ATPase
VEGVKISAVPTGRALGVAPLVGRDEELSALRQLWDQVAADRWPGLGVVLGQPGFGKNRLLHEFTAGLGTAPVHRGRCLSYGEGITYWPIAEIVRDAAGILRGWRVNSTLGERCGCTRTRRARGSSAPPPTPRSSPRSA